MKRTGLFTKIFIYTFSIFSVLVICLHLAIYFLFPSTYLSHRQETIGQKATGWIKDSGSWYYLNNSGSMATGWVKDSGSWYYLASSGKMLHNTYTPDGYYVDASGAWQ